MVRAVGGVESDTTFAYRCPSIEYILIVIFCIVHLDSWQGEQGKLFQVTSQHGVRIALTISMYLCRERTRNVVDGAPLLSKKQYGHSNGFSSHWICRWRRWDSNPAACLWVTVRRKSGTCLRATMFSSKSMLWPWWEVFGVPLWYKDVGVPPWCAALVVFSKRFWCAVLMCAFAHAI